MTETRIREHGMKLLREGLGLVESEIFINLLLKDSFDYTEWQKDLWPNKTIEDIGKIAREKGLVR